MCKGRRLCVPTRFGVNIKVQPVVAVFAVFVAVVYRVALEDEGVVFAPCVGGCVLCQHLVTRNGADLVRFAERIDIVIYFARVVFGYGMHIEHYLVVVVGVEELLGYEWVEFHLVDAHYGGVFGKGICKFTQEFVFCVIHFHGSRSVVFVCVDGIVDGVYPYVAVGGTQHTASACGGQFRGGRGDSVWCFWGAMGAVIRRNRGLMQVVFLPKEGGLKRCGWQWGRSGGGVCHRCTTEAEQEPRSGQERRFLHIVTYFLAFSYHCSWMLFAVKHSISAAKVLFLFRLCKF